MPVAVPLAASDQDIDGLLAPGNRPTVFQISNAAGPDANPVPTAAAENRADVVPTNNRVSVAQTFQPQARPDGPGITSQMRFGWPAVGRIIVGFCWHPDYKHDDGIAIAASPGAEMRAAEGGRIAYARDELRGLHNLILISHRDGWVSAYADAGEPLVKRGHIVERGQVIARIGDGGRLRFELRRNAIPVDPILYLGGAAPDVAQMTPGRCRG
jgi:murein DD-endopeptidase MepM/ murein hydrolase activator NlpD